MLGAITILTLVALLAIGLHIIDIRYDENKAKQAKLRQRAQDAIDIQKEVDTRKIENWVLDEIRRQELQGMSAYLADRYTRE